MSEPDPAVPAGTQAAARSTVRPARLCLTPVLAASLGVIALSYWYLLHAQPLADDFIRASDAVRYGPLNTVWIYYLWWGGRWVTFLLEIAYASLTDITRHYGPVLLVFSVLPWLAAWSAAVLIRGWRADRAGTWALAAMIMALLWLTTPSLGECWYWAPALVEYTMPPALTLCLLALLRRPPSDSTARRRAFGALVALLAVLAPAGHEMLGGLCLGFIVLDALYALRRREARARLSLLAAACALVSWLSAAAAPGNIIRWRDIQSLQAVHGADPGQLWAQFGALAGDCLGNSTLLAAWVLLLVWPRSPREPARTTSLVWAWAAPLLTLGSFAYVFWGAALVTHQLAPDRVCGAANLVLVIGGLFTCQVWRGRWAGSRLLVRLQGAPLVCLLAALALLTLVQRPNLRQALADAALAPRFQAAMQERFRYVESEVAAGRGQVFISDRIKWPGLYAAHLDLPMLGSDFRNEAWCLYFSAGSVIKTPAALVEQGPIPWPEMPGYVSGILRGNGKYRLPQPLVVLVNGREAVRCRAVDGLGQVRFAAVLRLPAGVRPPYEVKVALDLAGMPTPMDTAYRYPGRRSPVPLLERDKDGWFLRPGAGGRRIGVSRGALAGWLDEVKDLGREYLFWGWAANQDLDAPAREVILAVDSKVVWSGPPGYDRRDVARVMGKPDLARGGFAIMVPKDALAPGDAPRVLALDGDGRAGFIPPGPTARGQLKRLFPAKAK